MSQSWPVMHVAPLRSWWILPQTREPVYHNWRIQTHEPSAETKYGYDRPRPIQTLIKEPDRQTNLVQVLADEYRHPYGQILTYRS